MTTYTLKTKLNKFEPFFVEIIPGFKLRMRNDFGSLIEFEEWRKDHNEDDDIKNILQKDFLKILFGSEASKALEFLKKQNLQNVISIMSEIITIWTNHNFNNGGEQTKK
ncbi:Uncharacterised protein [Mesomycoplasma conjunctivae]|uniref:Uncharacterized protein n=1 Tax=Mesomycoplasma conjunctivae (strain ATCC 25834 / NCTC 10147 / HRC/581) TaxID=572263 RepID=C5J6S7_MESCH|nr:hypothetical protein [Mesomycoplasma conjunctivae]CAT05190.1 HYPOTHETICAL PROTEIN MCJ_004850 [Mesomycoplasma conjunctivae]VEU66401.1 Uncharacterised protein [Mesomycoplasma conjunctivae]